MVSKFCKQSKSLIEFMNKCEKYGVNPNFVKEVINSDIDGINHCNIEEDDLITECVNNHWYYFRELLGLDCYTERDLLYLSLMLKGITTIRCDNNSIEDSIVPALSHYLLRYGKTNNNIGIFTDDEETQQNVVLKAKTIHNNVPDVGNNLLFTNSHGYNPYTGRVLRVQSSTFGFINAKYSVGIFNIVDSLPYIFTEGNDAISSIGNYPDTTDCSFIAFYKKITEDDGVCLNKLLKALDSKYVDFMFTEKELYNLLEKPSVENIICVI